MESSSNTGKVATTTTWSWKCWTRPWRPWMKPQKWQKSCSEWATTKTSKSTSPSSFKKSTMKNGSTATRPAINLKAEEKKNRKKNTPTKSKNTLNTSSAGKYQKTLPNSQNRKSTDKTWWSRAQQFFGSWQNGASSCGASLRRSRTTLRGLSQWFYKTQNLSIRFSSGWRTAWTRDCSWKSRR